jgi:hypothetical protein
MVKTPSTPKRKAAKKAAVAIKATIEDDGFELVEGQPKPTKGLKVLNKTRKKNSKVKK